MLLTLYIVNKSGGLVYNRDLSPTNKLSGNEYLRVASTFHSLHAISKQLAPVVSGGIEVIDAGAYMLFAMETLTGITFFVTANKGTDGKPFLHAVYEMYADYVLKNAFYELDMPVRVKLFDHHLEAYIKKTGLGSLASVAASNSGIVGAPSAPMFVGTSS